MRIAGVVSDLPETDGSRGIGGDRGRSRRNAHIVALDLRRDLRKLRRRQFVAIGQHDGAKHGVLELADVSRPIISREQRQRVIGDAADTLALFDAKAGEKAYGQILHVAEPRAQRRNGDREYVEAIEKILAETARLDELDQVLVGRRDEAEVHLDGAPRADRIDLALLQRAQQLDLSFGRQLADLVQEQRPAVGLRELAHMLVGGASEGAFLMPEEDGFDEHRGQRAAIDDDEWLAASVGAALDRARHQFLADAGFAFDQDRYVRLGGALGKADGARHRFRAGDDVAEAQFAGVASRGPPEFVLERVDAQRVADRHL